MKEGIHDRDILSRPLSNPEINYKERSPEEESASMDRGSENILRMKYSAQIYDPTMSDEELRYILGGKGVKGFGGRPNAIEKIIQDRKLKENKNDMIKLVDLLEGEYYMPETKTPKKKEEPKKKVKKSPISDRVKEIEEESMFNAMEE